MSVSARIMNITKGSLHDGKGVRTVVYLKGCNMRCLLPFVDSFYVDIKHMDSEEHEKYTGCNNQRILDNIKRLAGMHNSVLIRTPLIPGVNDSTDNLIQTAAFAKSCKNGVLGLELLRYNILGESKYSLLQEKYVAFSEEPQSVSYMNELCRKINAAVNETDFVFWIQ